MEFTHRVVLMTAPDPAAAEALARALVDEGLAACVNVVPGVVSIYKWKGKTERDAEVLLIAKTLASRVDALVARVKKSHAYEVPEVLALPVVSGSPDYLKWLTETVK